jgi:hypothetical protein
MNRLWLLTISPALWATHFLVSYIGAAVWCGKLTDGAGGLGPVRLLTLGLAAAVLVGIGATGIAGWRKHTFRHDGSSADDEPHDEDTPEDQERFIGLATVLLSCLSAIATIYVAGSTLFVGGCH